MNDPTLAGPCAGYEFEIVELHEGALGPEEAGRVRAHLDACPRCREFQSRHAALDSALARALPRPALGADFGAKLWRRIEAGAVSATRGDLRAAAEFEHDRMLRALRRGARRRAIVSAAAGAAVAAVVIALSGALGPGAAALLQSIGVEDPHAMLVVLGLTAFVGALAWSAARGVLPGVRLRG